jgi:hypothetical protein
MSGRMAIVRISDRCKDLVRVRRSDKLNSTGTNRFRLEFLHRTVFDFLRDNFYDELVASSQGYSPSTSLARAYTYFLKKYDYDTLDRSGSFPTVSRAVFLAQDLPYLWTFFVNLSAGEADIPVNIVDEFIAVASKRSPDVWVEAFQVKHSNLPKGLFSKELGPLTVVISFSLPKYVQHLIERNPSSGQSILSQFHRTVFRRSKWP